MKLLKKQDLLPNMVIGLQKRVLTEPYPEHMHNYFEIEYILNGSGICLIDGVEYDIRPGALFFMTPANIQTIRTDHAELINLMFSSDPNEEGALARLLLSHTDPAFFLEGEDKEFTDRLLEEMSSVKYTPKMQESFLKCLLYKLSTLCNAPTVSAGSQVRQALLYTTENFLSELSLDKVARHVGISPNYLSMLFEREVGIGYKKYLDDLRFDHVKKLLSLTDLNVSQAYEKSGFVNYANFSRRFKQRYKMTPSEYRERAHRKKQP